MLWGRSTGLGSGMGLNEALGADLQELWAGAIGEGHICLYHSYFGKHCGFREASEILSQKSTIIFITLFLKYSSTYYPTVLLYFPQLTLASLYNTASLFLAS